MRRHRRTHWQPFHPPPYNPPSLSFTLSPCIRSPVGTAAVKVVLVEEEVAEKLVPLVLAGVQKLTVGM